MMTMLMIDSTIAQKSISIKRPARDSMSNGVISGASSVEQAVMVTESATLPRAKNAMTFDATPPEQEPIRMIPAATSGSNPSAVATAQPTSGMTENCSRIPTATAFGIFSALAKSWTLRVAPIENMISWTR